MHSCQACFYKLIFENADLMILLRLITFFEWFLNVNKLNKHTAHPTEYMKDVLRKTIQLPKNDSVKTRCTAKLVKV